MRHIAPGTRYKSMRVGNRLGSGMTGSVYYAVTKEGLEVALKVLESGDESVRDHFLSEATLLRQARVRRHPHLVEYVMSYTIAEPFYLATRFLPGSRELSALLRPRMTAANALQVAEQIGSALDYLHYGHPCQPVIHRDVKPANILIDSQGNALLIDLGAACHEGFHPAHNQGFGTLPYMPPEQYDGAEQPQSDQFALAMTVYQMLTGRPLLPNSAARAQAMLAQLRDTEHAALRAGVRAMPRTTAVLSRATAYDWRERYATCEQFAHALGLAMEADGAHVGAGPPLSLMGRLPWGYVSMVLVALLAISLLLLA